MEKDSIMEKKAKRFSYFSEFLRALPAPETPAEIRNEVNYLNKRLKTLSGKMRVTRETLSGLEKESTFYSNYKYALEKMITPITLITSPSTGTRKEKRNSLLERLEALSPERQEKLTKLVKKEPR